MKDDKLKHIFDKSKEEIEKNYDGSSELLSRIKHNKAKVSEQKKKILNLAYSMMVATIVLTGVYQYQKLNQEQDVEISLLNDFEEIFYINGNEVNNDLAYDSADTGDDEYVDEDDYLVDHYEIL